MLIVIHSEIFFEESKSDHDAQAELYALEH